MDIAFLMDGSWSIGKRRFQIQKDFMVEVSQALDVGVAGPIMGIIQYGYVSLAYPLHMKAAIRVLMILVKSVRFITAARADLSQCNTQFRGSESLGNVS